MWRPTMQSLEALRLRHAVEPFDSALRMYDEARVNAETRRVVHDDDDDEAGAGVRWTHCYAVRGRVMPYSVSKLLEYLFGAFERDTHAWRIARAPRTLSDAAYKYFQVGHAAMELVWEHVRTEHVGWPAADELFAHLAERGGVPAADDSDYTRAFYEHYGRVAYRELCAAWAQTSVRGTDEHLSAEAFYNGVYCLHLPRFQTPAFRQFLLWHAEWVFARKLVPFRTELRVCDFASALYDSNHNVSEAVCGTVDLLLADAAALARWRPGRPLHVVVVDYKFNDTVSDYADGYARAPLDRVRASKREKQASQLGAYTAMIETHTPLIVRSAHVAQFTRDAYHVYDMPRLRVDAMRAAFKPFIKHMQAQTAQKTAANE